MRTKVSVFAFLLITCFHLSVLAQNLSGVYTIGTSKGTEDYSTITGAIADLKSGTVVGNVEFQIGSGTFNEKMDLNSVNSGGFTITFSGVHKDSTFIHPLDSVVADSSGISVVNTRNIVLKNFTLKMSDISDKKVDYDYNGTKGINVSASSNISLKNVRLVDSNRVFTETYSEYIASALSLLDADTITIDSSSFSGAGILIYLENFKNVSITNCDFSNAQSHIKQFSIKNRKSEGISILKNTFEGPFPKGRTGAAIHLDADWQAFDGNSIVSYKGSSIIVKNNAVDAKVAAHDDDIYGVFTEGFYKSVVENNTIENGSYGIRVSGCDTATVEYNEVYNTSNNALYFKLNDNSDVANNIFTSSNYAAMTINTGSLRFVHNTLHGTDSLAALRVFGMSGDSLSILNNIFYVENTAESEVIVTDVVSDSIRINYNLYSGNAKTYTFLAYRLDATQGVGNSGLQLYAASFNDWQTGQALYDQNSKSFAPTFKGVKDYHITSGTAYRFGTPLADFTKDIDGDDRNSQTGIDVGADQYDGVVTSLQKITFSGIKVYPNVTSGRVTINSESEIKNATIRLLTIEGKIVQTSSFGVLKQEQFEIRVNSGLYLLQVESGGNVYAVERLLVK